MTGKYQELANEIGALVDSKNRSYGNSFAEAEDFLKLLYPTGVPVDRYGDMLCIVRIFDKLKRIATAKDLPEERKCDAYQDIVGYGLLGLEKETRVAAVSGQNLPVEKGPGGFPVPTTTTRKNY